MWSQRKEKKRKKEEKKREKGGGPGAKVQGTTATPNSKRSTPARSGDAIKLSVKDGQSTMGPGVAATPTGRIPVGDAASRDTWPGAAKQHRGA